jgi:hypothetical protein
MREQRTWMRKQAPRASAQVGSIDLSATPSRHIGADWDLHSRVGSRSRRLCSKRVDESLCSDQATAYSYFALWASFAFCVGGIVGAHRRIWVARYCQSQSLKSLHSWCCLTGATTRHNVAMMGLVWNGRSSTQCLAPRDIGFATHKTVVHPALVSWSCPLDCIKGLA